MTLIVNSRMIHQTHSLDELNELLLDHIKRGKKIKSPHMEDLLFLFFILRILNSPDIYILHNSYFPSELWKESPLYVFVWLKEISTTGVMQMRIRGNIVL